MSNENKIPEQENTGWLDEILNGQRPEPGPETHAEEAASLSAGSDMPPPELPDPDEMPVSDDTLLAGLKLPETEEADAPAAESEALPQDTIFAGLKLPETEEADAPAAEAEALPQDTILAGLKLPETEEADAPAAEAEALPQDTILADLKLPEAEAAGEPDGPELIPLGSREEPVPQEEPAEDTPVSKKNRKKDKKDDTVRVLDDIDKTPKRKIRPKFKKGYGFLGIPHILSTFIWMAVVVIVGVSLGRTLWVCCADLLAFGKPDKSITITVTEEDDITAISQKLADAGLIEYPQLFEKFATLTHKDADICPGTFTLNCYYDYNAMINAMSYHAAAREEVTLTIPEGYTCAQIFALLEEQGVCSVEDLETTATEGAFESYWFLEGVEQDSKYWLEGFLFPDTYDFYVGDDAQRVLNKMLDNFDYRFTDLMMEDFQTLQSRYATALSAIGYSNTYVEANQLTLHDVIILASIVEKESAGGSESYNISSVFFNRLCDPGNYPQLGSDATVHYAIGDYFGEVTELTYEQIHFNSPYNTRLASGLPPGAICNPGASSIYAALDPNETNYHYFLLDPNTGEHRFAENYAQHLKNQEELGY